MCRLGALATGQSPLFGLAHLPGGWEVVPLPGVAYRYRGLLAVVAGHFSLFTDPMLAY